MCFNNTLPPYNGWMFCFLEDSIIEVGGLEHGTYFLIEQYITPSDYVPMLAPLKSTYLVIQLLREFKGETHPRKLAFKKIAGPGAIV